jgi:hypothetical protein
MNVPTLATWLLLSATNADNSTRWITLRGYVGSGTTNPAGLSLSVDLWRPLSFETGFRWGRAPSGFLLVGREFPIVDRRNALGRGETVDAQLSAGLEYVARHDAHLPPQPASSTEDYASGGSLSSDLEAAGVGVGVKAAYGVLALASIESTWWLAKHLGISLRASVGASVFPLRTIVFGADASEWQSAVGTVTPEFKLEFGIAF